MDRGIVHTESLYVWASYDSVAQAEKAVRNTRTKGWKLKGKHVPTRNRDDMIVSTLQEFQKLDVMVTVMSLNAYSGGPFRPVQIRKSQVGGPCDPSTERYWCM